MAADEADDDQCLNHLFDYFLPVLEKYLPIEAVATHLLQAGLLSRTEYLTLKEGGKGKLFKRTSRIVRLVDHIASKGPRSFLLFYRTLEVVASDEGDGDVHLGLQHCVEEMQRVMKDKGCVARRAEFETDHVHSPSGSVPLSPLYTQSLRRGHSMSKWSVCSAPPERFRSRHCSSASSSDSGLSLSGMKDSKTTSLEQVDQHLSVLFADMKKSIVEPLVAQIHFLEQQLLDSQEREAEMKQREEDLRKSNDQALKEKEDVERHLANYVRTIGRLETECKEMKAQVSAYEKQRRAEDMLCSDSEYRSRAPLCSQLSINSVCSDSSMGTQEGIYYTSQGRCMCTANLPTCDYLHSVRMELPESSTLPRKRHSLKKYLPKRASSFSGKQSPMVVSSAKKHFGSLPGASTSCLKQAHGEEAGSRQLLSCKEESTEPYIPIMMVSTC